MAATGEASEAAAPAAWYPAPGDPGAWRWNGERWTNDMARVVVAPETWWTSLRLIGFWLAGTWVGMSYLSVVGTLVVRRWTDLDPLGVFAADYQRLGQSLVLVVGLALLDRYLGRRGGGVP